MNTIPISHPMRFMPSDQAILEKLFSFDGLLTRRQLKELFFAKAHQKTMDRRLSMLHHNHYLAIPSLSDRRNYAIPEPIVWLGWRGILQIATKSGSEIVWPTKVNENQLRKLEKVLREQNVHWQRTPRWSQLRHDIAVNDIRLAVEQASYYYPQLELDTWMPERAFARNMDTITVHGRKKGIRPDGFFTLLNHSHRIQGQAAKARFLLEYDNSTHPTTRFGRDKALPGYHYLKSEVYRERFGYNSGRWLVVCKNATRLAHLKQKTELVLGKQATVFYFTTLDQVTAKQVFQAPIWQQAGKNNLVALIPSF